MLKITSVFQHRNKLYLRKKIPNTQTNLVLSLQTDSLSVAKKTLAIITPKVYLLLEKLKREEMTLQEIRTIINSYINEAMKEYSHIETLRHNELSFVDEDGSKYGGHSKKAIDRAIEYYINVIESDDVESISKEAAKILNRSNIEDEARTVPTQDIPVFNHELLKSEVNILNYDKERNYKRLTEATDIAYEPVFEAFKPKGVHTNIIKGLADEFGLNNAQAILTALTEDNKPNRFYLKRAIEIFDEFMTMKEGIKEPFRYIADIKDLFLSYMGKEYLCDITQEEYQVFTKDVQYLPPKNGRYKAMFQNINIRELLRKSKDEKFDVISEGTLKDKLININAFLDFAVELEYLDKNRFKYQAKNAKSINKTVEDRRKEYRPHQIQAMLQVPDYTDNLIYNLKNMPSRVWIPLILLYQGFRINEIAQLYINQIEVMDNIPLFKLKEKYEEQNLKNKASSRKVPIHPQLLALGFMKFVEEQKNKGNNRLFSELYYTNRKGYGQAFSKYFRETVRKQFLSPEDIQKIENKTIMLDLHSFRHCFSGKLKGKIEDSLLDYLMGHKSKDYEYGKFQPAVMLKGIKQCTYDLDFRDLKARMIKYYKTI